jgi:hypothetical protein
MTLYIYNPDTRETVAAIHGDTEAACERVVKAFFSDPEYYAATYTPGFGSIDGLILTDNCQEIKAN